MFTVGRFFTNCYVVGCEQTREAILIDPGFDDHFEAEKIFKFVDENVLTLKIIVNTHGHPDHTCGNGMVKEKVHVPILVHEQDAHMFGESGEKIAEFFGFENSSPPADMLLHDTDLVKFGKIILKVMHTPGHSRGSISLLGEKEVFTGDTLFAGSIGRTDFPESSELDMKFSLRELADLPDHFVVYPGHGPVTTIGEEKRSNPFLQWL
ncbi:MAG: MBL fold metallo-hydrolase [Candidatus Bathyarchaeia archaeon]|nr:MBL fold metallo-hydrolase [Candidatus Bathyarchaeia archaeon]